jgi:hypothetical protein
LAHTKNCRWLIKIKFQKKERTCEMRKVQGWSLRRIADGKYQVSKKGNNV